MIRNIIFDWSGTLVDDLPAVWQATNHVFRSAGLPEMSLETFRAEFSLPFKNFYDRFTPNIPFPQLETWFREHFQTGQNSVAPLPHSREFLQTCHERGLKTFVLSSVLPEAYATQAKSTGFDAFIDQAFPGVLDKRLKLPELMKSNMLLPDETLLIGDMEHDIEAARVGGVFSCGVLTGYNSLAQLREAKPDIIAEHLSELRRTLDEHDWDLHYLRDVHYKPAARFPIPTVGALIYNAKGDVLMIQTQKWSSLWGIPGGKIQYGETSVDALRREIAEETGLRVKNIRHVMTQDCVQSKEFFREAHFILLNYTCVVDGPEEVILNHEAQAWQWISWPEALQLPLNQPTRLLIEKVVEIPF